MVTLKKFQSSELEKQHKFVTTAQIKVKYLYKIHSLFFPLYSFHIIHATFLGYLLRIFSFAYINVNTIYIIKILANNTLVVLRIC